MNPARKLLSGEVALYCVCAGNTENPIKGLMFPFSIYYIYGNILFVIEPVNLAHVQ